MIGEGAGPQVQTDRRLVARQHALHAAITLELGLAGGGIRDGLSASDADRARNVVLRSAEALERWLLREVDPVPMVPTDLRPRPTGVDLPPAPETEI